MSLLQIFTEDPYSYPANVWADPALYVAQSDATTTVENGPYDLPCKSVNFAGETVGSDNNAYQRCLQVASLNEPLLCVGIWLKGLAVNSGTTSIFVLQDSAGHSLRCGPANIGLQNKVNLISQPQTGDTAGQVVVASSADNVVDMDQWHFYEWSINIDGNYLDIHFSIDEEPVLLEVIENPFSGTIAHFGVECVKGDAGTAQAFLHGGYIGENKFGPILSKSIRPTSLGALNEWALDLTDVDLINNINSDGAVVSGYKDKTNTFQVEALSPVTGSQILGLFMQGIIRGWNDVNLQGVIAEAPEEATPAATPETEILTATLNEPKISQAVLSISPTTNLVFINPFTQSLWTTDEINEAEFGIKGV